MFVVLYFEWSLQSSIHNKGKAVETENVGGNNGKSFKKKLKTLLVMLLE